MLKAPGVQNEGRLIVDKVGLQLRAQQRLATREPDEHAIQHLRLASERHLIPLEAEGLTGRLQWFKFFP